MDFVVTRNRRVYQLIEVKKSDDSPSRGLKLYTEKLQPAESLQLVMHLDRAQEKSGIKIQSLGKWMEKLAY